MAPRAAVASAWSPQAWSARSARTRAGEVAVLLAHRTRHWMGRSQALRWHQSEATQGTGWLLKAQGRCSLLRSPLPSLDRCFPRRSLLPTRARPILLSPRCCLVYWQFPRSARRSWFSFGQGSPRLRLRRPLGYSFAIRREDGIYAEKSSFQTKEDERNRAAWATLHNGATNRSRQRRSDKSAGWLDRPRPSRSPGTGKSSGNTASQCRRGWRR